MRIRILLLLVVLGLLGWLGLQTIQWQFGLGEFAKSPQRILLQGGRRSIVGGGRAVLSLAVHTRDRVVFELSCAGERRQVELRRDKTSDEVCGVRVRWLGSGEPGQPEGARFEVTWDADQPDQDPG